MARVWVAKLRGKHGFEKMVALKTILPTFAQDQRFRRMFLDEAKIASGIEHVNVAQILDLGEQAGQLYLVMEWVDGDSLQELDRAAEKAGAALPIPVLVRVIADACAGLHAAHELADVHGRTLNVVHRDVSPHNILISAKGVVKVIDFGVVKARRRLTEETTTGTIKGKLQYMAPEQALGQGVDSRSDIWAVGATLYRLLARRPVYPGASPLSTFKRLTSTLAPEPLPPHIPGALSTIVLKALAFEPERRFSTAAELGSALEALLQGPYQTTSREVAACVEQYLGPALALRRTAISEALEERSPAERTQPNAPEWESGVSQAQTLPRGAHSAPPSAPPTAVDRLVPSSPNDEVTRPLQQAPAPTTSRRSKLVAAGGVLSLGAALAWGFGAPGAHPKPTPVDAPVHARLPTAPVTPASPAPPPVAEAPAQSAPAGSPVAAPSAEPPPMFTIDAPLSVQALPIAPAPPVAKKKPVAPAPRPVAVARPLPKRKVVDDGF